MSLVVLLSLVLYVGGLGFYSDDWAHLKILNTSRDQSLFGLIDALYSGDIVIRQRPSQVLYLAVLYWLFGAHPFGYHVANALVLLANALLLYLVIRELQQPRLVAVTVPAVYALLPHYSTDRFWPAAFQATLSIALYLCSLYADLRALRHGLAHLWRWKLLSLLSIIGSGLAYEVTLPLFLFLNPLLVWYQAQQQYGRREGRRIIRANAARLLGSNLLALVVVIGFKLLVSVRLGLQTSYIDHVVYLVTGATKVNYGTYGVGLPYIIWWILRNNPDWTMIALSGVMGLIVWRYLNTVAGQSQVGWPRKAFWFKSIVLGLLVFALGYAIFLNSADIWFTSTSLGNRISIAAAMGIALTFVGGCGWLSILLSQQHARRVFCLLITLLCISGFMINNTLAAFWVAAYRQQQAIINDIQKQFPTIPSESTLILDGTCFEHGGAYVFTGGRDVAGALVMAYQDPSLWATAIVDSAQVEENGISISTFRRNKFYAYNEKLFVYNIAQHKLYGLTDAATTQRYFQQSPFDPQRDCPPGFAWNWNAFRSVVNQPSNN